MKSLDLLKAVGQEYWFGDPLMVRAYYKAYQLRREQVDEEAWLTGQYVLGALNATVCNMFRKQGQPPAEYPKEPILMTRRRELEQKRREKTEREKEQEAAWAKAWMTSFVQAGKNFGKNRKREAAVEDPRQNETQEGDVPWPTVPLKE